MKVYLDTNVVMEFFTQRTQYATVRKIMRAAELGLLTACISTISLSTIVYLLGLRLKEKGIHEPEKRNTIRALLIDLEEYVNIVDLTHEQTNKALKDKSFKDIEDSLQYYCADENDSDCIVTINIKDFPVKKDGINVYTPAEFVNMFMV